jgi:hypothetical protein
MKATKIFIVLAATAAIALAVMGVAYGYYASNQVDVNDSSPSAADGGFWGWLGGCFGFAHGEAYGYQHPPAGDSTVQPPAYGAPQYPYQPQNPDQDYYQYGYGHGCWGW